MALAWCVSVRLGAGVVGWCMVICSIKSKNRKVQLFRDSAFHLSPGVYVDNLGSTLAFNWQKGWSEVTDEENVVNHQEQVELCDHSHDDL